MSVTYVCPKCEARMALESRVDSLKCPVCRVAMTVEGSDTASGRNPKKETTRVPASAPAVPAFKGLKVARPVRNLGEPQAPADAVRPANPKQNSETQTFPTQSKSSSDSLAQEMEKMVQGARQQAQAEAEDILAKARDQAAKDAEAYALQAREAVEAQIAELRKTLKSEAENKAEEILRQAREEAAAVRTEAEQEGQAAITEIRDKALKEAEKARETMVEEAESLKEAIADLRKQRQRLEKSLSAPAASEAEGTADQTQGGAAKRGIGSSADSAGESDQAESEQPREQDDAAGEDDSLGSLKQENQRLRASIEKQSKHVASAKQDAFRDANEAHKLQFRISLLLRVMGPVLLFYGVFMAAKAEQGIWRGLSYVLLAFAIALSIWGLLLGRKLRHHIDGLFEFVFKERLAGRSPDANGGVKTNDGNGRGHTSRLKITGNRRGETSPKAIKISRDTRIRTLAPRNRDDGADESRAAPGTRAAAGSSEAGQDGTSEPSPPAKS